ncbi:aldo/keto reductase [Streptomyces platensis]|uniref:Aldo/keto reductase n=1 Tax=Streptomyces platensis TaxID=58346 RepID=A0AAE6NFJ2_STRPT|nr:aldo/keto reductase [Streptomyces platensis]OSY47084.1 putative oxidoreductase [Streptomyces platensis]QEV51010.1 aldo/keto reductase [Streptomyces platensis]
MTAAVPAVTLNNGVTMPQLGFGAFQVGEKEIATALENGYRSIDTASAYGNESDVGRALRSSGIARDEVFVTTKVWNTDQGYGSTLAAFDASLARLRLDYVDLYLVHWPAPARNTYLDTWRALEKIHADGRARAIGVSNFRPADLLHLLDAGGTVPAVNQIELHPHLQQAELRAFHARHGIVTEAWGPLARGGLLRHPAIVPLAGRLGRTPAQVVLRWHLQLGNVAIPKSATPERIRQNLDVFDFELTDADMAAIAALDNGTRTGPDPDFFN